MVSEWIGFDTDIIVHGLFIAGLVYLMWAKQDKE